MQCLFATEFSSSIYLRDMYRRPMRLNLGNTDMKLVCLPCETGNTFINVDYIVTLQKNEGGVAILLTTATLLQTSLSLKEILERLSAQDWGKS